MACGGWQVVGSCQAPVWHDSPDNPNNILTFLLYIPLGRELRSQQPCHRPRRRPYPKHVWVFMSACQFSLLTCCQLRLFDYTSIRPTVLPSVRLVVVPSVSYNRPDFDSLLSPSVYSVLLLNFTFATQYGKCHLFMMAFWHLSLLNMFACCSSSVLPSWHSIFSLWFLSSGSCRCSCCCSGSFLCRRQLWCIFNFAVFLLDFRLPPSAPVFSFLHG